LPGFDFSPSTNGGRLGQGANDLQNNGDGLGDTTFEFGSM